MSKDNLPMVHFYSPGLLHLLFLFSVIVPNSFFTCHRTFSLFLYMPLYVSHLKWSVYFVLILCLLRLLSINYSLPRSVVRFTTFYHHFCYFAISPMLVLRTKQSFQPSSFYAVLFEYFPKISEVACFNLLPPITIVRDLFILIFMSFSSLWSKFTLCMVVFYFYFSLIIYVISLSILFTSKLVCSPDTI